MYFNRITILLFIIIGFFTSIACQRAKNDTVSAASTSYVEGLTVADSLLNLRPEIGLVYHENKPFTGTSMTHYTNGNPSVSIHYFNGKKQGLYRKWFEEGTLSFESAYVDGKKEGIAKSWWRNGNLRTESNYKQGVPQGLQLQWYKSGAKFKRLQLVDGKEEGLQQSWRENGKLYNNYEAKNGRIFGLKRASLCYALEDETVQYKGE